MHIVRKMKNTMGKNGTVIYVGIEKTPSGSITKAGTARSLIKRKKIKVLKGLLT